LTKAAKKEAEEGRIENMWFTTSRGLGQICSRYVRIGLDCTMRLLHLCPLVVLGACVTAWAATPTQVMQWRSGLIELDQGWVEHDGDNLQWSRPDLDESQWNAVDLDDMGPAQAGWHWYRQHVNLGPDHTEVRLLVAGGAGTYELYVNGVRAPGPRLRSSLMVTRPVEIVFPLSEDSGDFHIALRTHVPAGYAAWHLPQFTNVTIGLPTAIDYERQALESQRTYSLAPSICMNVLLYLAGIGSLALYVVQRKREYLFLGSYLLLVGISNGLSMLQSAGLAPLSANFLIADPLIYAWVLAQIEFTYAFAGRRVANAWRIYEVSLLLCLFVVVLTFGGRFRSDTYVLIEAAVTAPVGLLLSILLFVWNRQGNREAGWLIVPSLAPAISTALLDLGTASIYLDWRPFYFLVQAVQIGPIALQLVDIGSFLFLISIAIVMLFRFTRIGQEQARAAAELAAAREIQRHLVPAVLPDVPNCQIEAAYFPAQEVGGDFYQVLPYSNGSIMIVVGDVSGKGLKAAMTGTLAIGALRSLAADISDPGPLLARLNREVIRGQDSGFITCICVKLDPNGKLTISNAGHLAPYKNGEELTIKGGLPLGLAPDLIYAESCFELTYGDTLMLLSDGVVEARDTNGELFGFERTHAISTRSAEEIAKAAMEFGQEDDITVVKLTHSSL
jgi:serine phosphatase RsbU (regulator of sigma subunit)